MESESLLEALRNHVVQVQFLKADGSVRVMEATLKSDLLPVKDTTDLSTSEILNTFKVWDVEKQAWRSFRMDRLQNWQVLNPGDTP